jgi:CubicO group peptidase (beta-lactamase class C family)
MYNKARIIEGNTVAAETVGDAVKRLAQIPLLFHPGEQWQYGFSIDVLGYLVEVLSEFTLEEFFRVKIFQPLKMSDSYFYPPDRKLERVVDYYFPAPEYSGIEAEVGVMRYTPKKEYFDGPRTYFAGGAGLITTVVDYWRFAQMLLNGGSLEGVRVLSPRTVDLMTSNTIGNKDIFISGYGDKMGLAAGIRAYHGRVGELESNGSFGWGGAYNHIFWVDPEEDLIGIIMTQRVPGKTDDLLSLFKVLTYQSIVD